MNAHTQHTLGLNAFHADASAALLSDGLLVAAVEEERLNRVKHCAGFPSLAAAACLQQGGIRPGDITHVAVSRDPSANVLRKLLHVLGKGRSTALDTLFSRLTNAAKLRSIDDRLAEALGVAKLDAKFHPVEHHRAHLASAFFVSPFADAAVLSLDGFGDFVSTMWASGRDTSLQILGQVGYPHSIGVIYTATTQWLGFPNYGDEGKVMGLAPYGKPRFVNEMRRMCQLTADGFELDLSWFTHATSGVEMTWENGQPTIGKLFSDRFIETFGPVRAKTEPLTDHHHDVAASLQAFTEEIVFHIAHITHRATKNDRLCLAGGVALNSVANGKLRANTPFKEIFVQPAAGDNGTAIGAALYVDHAILGRPRRFVMQHPATGPEYDTERCASAIERLRANADMRVTHLPNLADLVERAAAAVADGKVLGWFQGKMEFGPRALGNRSVIADPRRADMKDILNSRIKHREAFRPFAPVILAEKTAEWFEDAQPSPAMLMVLPFRKDKQALVPAVVHVDGSGRLQTVERADNPPYYDLIAAFEKKTGVPILLNTSFNENEPIVCKPEEAVDCFDRTKMDVLALGPFFVERLR